MLAITLVGGDLRQIYLARILAEAGHQVRIVGIPMEEINNLLQKEQSKYENITFYSCDNLDFALKDNDLILGPIPFTKNKENLHCAYPDFFCPVDYFIKLLSPSQYLIAGMIPDTVTKKLEEKNINYYDYLKNQSFAKMNAIATAEGAISYAIEHSTDNMHLNNVLVLGYGICGSVIASKCKALGAHVTVTGRREETKDNAITNGFYYISTDELINAPDLDKYAYIFSTVPHMVLTKPILSRLSKEATIVDIASAPGSIDYECAGKLSLNTYLYLGIPGKIAPKASAKILYDIILNRLKERSQFYVPQYR